MPIFGAICGIDDLPYLEAILLEDRDARMCTISDSDIFHVSGMNLWPQSGSLVRDINILMRKYSDESV